MNKTIGFAAGMAAIVTAALPSLGHARSFAAYPSTTPILYRYAACVFDNPEVSAEQQLAACADLKTSLLEEAEIVIQNFHTRNRSTVRLELKRGIREVEKDAKRSREQSKPVPITIVAYLKCMGEGVMATDEYKAGDAVSYIGVQEECKEQEIAASALIPTKQELRREEILYERFRRHGRVTYPQAELSAKRSSSRQRFSYRRAFNNSFLDLRILPADRKPAND